MDKRVVPKKSWSRNFPNWLGAKCSWRLYGVSCVAPPSKRAMKRSGVRSGKQTTSVIHNFDFRWQTPQWIAPFRWSRYLSRSIDHIDRKVNLCTLIWSRLLPHVPIGDEISYRVDTLRGKFTVICLSGTFTSALPRFQVLSTRGHVQWGLGPT